MMQRIADHLPPITVAAVLLFWALAPAAWVESPWTMPIAGLAVIALVQGLEYRIERHPGWRMDRREFLTDAFYVVLNMTAISWAAGVFADDPMVAARKSLGLDLPSVANLPFLAQVMLIVVISEFGQYWMHRLMHNNALFWSTHAPHHHITQLNAMKGFVGNPIELFLISLSVVALFDFDTAPTLAAFHAMSTISIYAHANVRADPPIWYSYFFTTIRHHSLHHTALSYDDTRCNYGNILILLDRIFGTYREGESAVVGQDQRQRLTIRQQWTWPFQPLIDRLRRPAVPAP